jgi:hypothetical protein
MPAAGAQSPIAFLRIPKPPLYETLGYHSDRSPFLCLALADVGCRSGFDNLFDDR